MKEKLKDWVLWFGTLPFWAQRLWWKLLVSALLASCVFIKWKPAHEFCTQFALELSLAASTDFSGADGGTP